MSIALYYIKIALPAIEKVAHEHGYAVGVHGSMMRDFDLIAAPWSIDASSSGVLAEAVAKAIGGYILAENFGDNPMPKPHGRVGYTIMVGGGAYIDLSVMPLVKTT
jgi:hypothetical protein